MHSALSHVLILGKRKDVGEIGKRIGRNRRFEGLLETHVIQYHLSFWVPACELT